MSKKHFIQLAEMVKNLPADEAVRAEVAAGIARIAKGDNPRFDNARFMAACGL